MSMQCLWKRDVKGFETLYSIFKTAFLHRKIDKEINLHLDLTMIKDV